MSTYIGILKGEKEMVGHHWEGSCSALQVFSSCPFPSFKHFFLLFVNSYTAQGDKCVLLLIIAWLAISRTEELFAELAHFPVSAIQLAFTVIVLPCLLLAYSGQAAYLIQNTDHVADELYRSIPGKCG